MLHVKAKRQRGSGLIDNNLDRTYATVTLIWQSRFQRDLDEGSIPGDGSTVVLQNMTNNVDHKMTF